MQIPKMEKAENLDAILRAFRPEPLTEETLTEFYYKDTMTIRTGDPHKSPLKKLFKACTTPCGTNAHLFMGHMGCGKSTELYHIKRQFEQAGHSVCIIDVRFEMDSFRLTCWDMMLLITEGLCKIAEKTGAEIPKEPLNEIMLILKKDTVITKTVDEQAEISVSAGADLTTPSILSGLFKLFFSVRSSQKLSADTNTVVKEKIERRASEWFEYTKEIAAHITANQQGKQPIIIFEGLDKLPETEKIFDILHLSVLSQMPFPVIYTFPINELYTSNFAKIRAAYMPHTFPMIKVSDFDKSKYAAGIKAMQEIVKLRANITLFAQEDAEDGVLAYLIEKTGGSLRHLFECIISAAQRTESRGAEQIEKEDADSALSELRKELTRMITRSRYDVLAEIYNHPEAREQIDDSVFLLEMMKSSVLLEYENGERWHDLHPLIADFLERHQKITKRGANE